MNDEFFRMDMEYAALQSPALKVPLVDDDCRILCVCGGNERPEFKRQNRLLPLMWEGFDVNISVAEVPDYNHFTIVNLFGDAESIVMKHLFG
eukprot:CAMPEP_0118709440 /NCGR_PEP_ID=MMETSP0800-20121206/22641_1 /TAXON_ID=210618 ORGANISM="Striatella unipunctata, Strain CCMP2910" /NCGR_SAMPLE_ID=MMETSP0800 /ASSEMBLY_ACC=CAM_ASM_000638 /LENGTH=91 /DNA_ID=CAMNT_0006613139 /DNA_START=72 /DNA_END=347 /DNA_ORIENTATION=+